MVEELISPSDGVPLDKVSCPVCGARFRWTHVCRKMPKQPCITRELVQNPPKWVTKKRNCTEPRTVYDMTAT